MAYDWSYRQEGYCIPGKRKNKKYHWKQIVIWNIYQHREENISEVISNIRKVQEEIKRKNKYSSKNEENFKFLNSNRFHIFVTKMT